MRKGKGSAFLRWGLFAVLMASCCVGVRAEAAMLQYTLPNGIYFAEKDGRPIPTSRAIVMEGGDVRTLYVDVMDFGNDNDTRNDYVDYYTPVSGDNTLTLIEGSVIEGADAIRYLPSALIDFRGEARPPRRLGFVRIEAIQPASGYQERRASFAVKYSYEWTEKGSDSDKLFHRITPALNVLVRPRDTGGAGGDNGGGSCDALSLGAMALVIPTLWVLRRKR